MFLDFIKGLLDVDPRSRFGAADALKHEFITTDKFKKQKMELETIFEKSESIEPSKSKSTCLPSL